MGPDQFGGIESSCIFLIRAAVSNVEVSDIIDPTKRLCKSNILVLFRTGVVQDPNFEIDVQHWNPAPVERPRASSRL